jgi:hypothetical protein
MAGSNGFNGQVRPSENGPDGHWRHRLDVARWLQAHGVGHTIKPHPDARGRTVYVLDQCPFDPAHGKDACITQEPGGKLGAQCFHNGCSGQGWQAFKQAIGAPDPDHYDPPLPPRRGRRRGRRGQAGDVADAGPPPAPPDGSGEDGEVGEHPAPRPEILVTTEEHDVNDQASQALSRCRDVYQRGGVLVRLVRDTSPAHRGIRRPLAPRIDPLPPALLRECLTACARWLTPTRDREGEEQFCPARPPAWCVAAVHARADWPGVPHLEAVVDYPVLRPDGTVLAAPGYDLETGLLLEVDGASPDVPECPTHEQAVAARDELLDVVGDFPFESEAHRSAWLAALLTPLARFAFTGPAPLFLADANVRAAGKGLLLDCIAFILTGKGFAVDPEAGVSHAVARLAVAAVGGAAAPAEVVPPVAAPSPSPGPPAAPAPGSASSPPVRRGRRPRRIHTPGRADRRSDRRAAASRYRDAAPGSAPD